MTVRDDEIENNTGIEYDESICPYARLTGSHYFKYSMYMDNWDDYKQMKNFSSLKVTCKYCDLKELTIGCASVNNISNKLRPIAEMPIKFQGSTWHRDLLAYVFNPVPCFCGGDD